MITWWRNALKKGPLIFKEHLLLTEHFKYLLDSTAKTSSITNKGQTFLKTSDFVNPALKQIYSNENHQGE